MLLVGAVTCLALTVLFGACSPLALRGRSWVYRHPRCGLALWIGSLLAGAAFLVTALSFVLVAAFEVAAQPARSTPSAGSDLGAAGTYVLGWILTAVVGGLGCVAAYHAGIQAWRTRTVRRQVGAALVTCAERRSIAGGQVLVIPQELPAAVSVPGRRPLIAVSARLCAELDEAELAAVVAHEQAHLDQRHAVLTQLAAVHHACLPRSVGARSLEGAVHTLVELAADDVAARRCGAAVVASALRKAGRSDEGLALRAARLESRLALAAG